MYFLNIIKILVFVIILLFLVEDVAYTENNTQHQNSVTIAQNTKSKESVNKAKTGREKVLIKEKTIKTPKGREKSKIDFEEVDILGKRQTPFGSIITKNQADKEFELIKIRLDWKPELIQSTNNLETGRIR